MKLLLNRDTFTDKSTTGTLSVDGKFQCYILEDVDRKLEAGGVKVYGETCIPRGTYEIEINYSPRFKREMPLLLNVPGFSGVRIHSGNTDRDTEGCLLPGVRRGVDVVRRSVSAYEALFAKLIDAEELGETITIEIV